MIDTGAGPCVIDLMVLNGLDTKKKVNIESAGGSLKGVGASKVIGTVSLNVNLHPDINGTQVFKIVENLDGMILLGRSFLKKFNSLEVDWSKMMLKINGKLIKGNSVIQGGKLDSRVCIAQDKVINESIDNQLREHVRNNDYLSEYEKDCLEDLLIEYADIFVENPKSPPKARLVSHVIDTGNSQPVKNKLRRLPTRWMRSAAT